MKIRYTYDFHTRRFIHLILYGFAGYAFDLESRTYSLGGGIRQYNPNIGRFMQRDPLGFAAGDLNLFRYVKNNPARFVDPSGECGLFIANLVLNVFGLGLGNIVTGCRASLNDHGSET